MGVLAVMDRAIAVAMKRAIALSTLAECETRSCEPETMVPAVDAFEEAPGADAPREDESSEVR